MIVFVYFRYVALVSGVELGGNSEEDAATCLSLQLMTDMLTGQLGDMCDQRQTATVTRIILAGNSISSQCRDKDSIKLVRT